MPGVDLDGLVLIGPGSEWFWSMASGIVLAVTFIAIYRQLRLQAGAGAVEQMHAIQRDWEMEVLARHRLTILLELRDGTDPANVSMGAANPVADYWERLGYLVRAGHISAALVREYNGSAAKYWWGILGPGIRAARLEISNPGLFEHFEWLARRMAEIDRQKGGPDVDDAYVARLLPRLMELEVAAIRAAELSRGAAGSATPARAATTGQIEPRDPATSATTGVRRTSRS